MLPLSLIPILRGKALLSVNFDLHLSVGCVRPRLGRSRELLKKRPAGFSPGMNRLVPGGMTRVVPARQTGPERLRHCALR